MLNGVNCRMYCDTIIEMWYYWDVFVYWYRPLQTGTKSIVYWYVCDKTIQLLVLVIIIYLGQDHFNMVRCGTNCIQQWVHTVVCTGMARTVCLLRTGSYQIKMDCTRDNI
jgi:hypothetical protein